VCVCVRLCGCVWRAGGHKWRARLGLDNATCVREGHGQELGTGSARVAICWLLCDSGLCHRPRRFKATCANTPHPPGNGCMRTPAGLLTRVQPLRSSASRPGAVLTSWATPRLQRGCARACVCGVRAAGLSLNEAHARPLRAYTQRC